ncbi:DUF2092 domain-containing protein [Stenotrophomonas aracearum]|jgi:hypothetical protein|uniref:DUF2092 domain-containing protein n=1 Tax=Stenotrophomonas aracearum TaxID=3003272 RepID=A0ABY9Y8I1_9GAMM|nr:DUF2092 domain-containing protein [Stenotrophomonas sp. A5588]WNH47169.1 DUF2092 domain-containing protein [Stenotrophomonas sp. A5588]
MRRSRSCLLLALLLAAPWAWSTAVAAPPTASETVGAATRDPDAIAALERMGKALRALPQFTLAATTRTEYVLDDGQKLALAGTVDYKVLGPDRFFVEIRSDHQHRQLFYDGHTLTIASPAQKFYAQVENLDRSSQALLSDSATQLGIEFPLADLFLWGTPGFPTERIDSALFVGTERIDEQPTRHYAFRQPGVDWQVWISDTTRLPLQLLITSHSDPALPSYLATLNWDTKRSVAANDLVFRPDGATRIVFVPVAVASDDTVTGGQ